MDDKSINFKMKFDTRNFEQTVAEIQGKLNRIYGQANAGSAQANTNSRLQAQGLGGSAGNAAFERSTMNHHRELASLIKDESQSLAKQGENLAAASKKLDDMVKKQREMKGSVEDELKIRKQIAATTENNFRLQKDYMNSQSNLNTLLDESQKNVSPLQQIKNAYQGSGGGLGGAKAAAGAANGLIGSSGGITGLIAAVTALAPIVRAGSDAYKYLGNAAITTASATGSATAGTVGREVSGIYGNRQAYEMAFMPEKSRAAAMAGESMRRVSNTQMLDAGTDVAGGALSMGLKGAALGATGGAFLGGVGAVPGAIIGGVGGLALGAMNGMRSGSNMSTLLSPMSSKAMADRQAGLAKQFSDKYNEALQGEKDQNPMKTAAAENYQQNYSRDLDLQRGMGADYSSYHGVGGFKDGITQAGFTNDMGAGMANSILGAGGSSRSAMGNSAFGLQLQRGNNLTNSSSVLGTLSGGLGSSESTKAATIKILAEGMKLGLDDSKFASENRKFTQAAADVLVKSAASSGSDMNRVNDSFGSFQSEKTSAGIDAGKGAFEQYQQMSSATSGPRGVMRASGMLSDPALSKLSTMSKQALMQVPDAELNEDNSIVQNAAEESGISTKDVVDRVRGVNKKSVSRFQGTDDNISKLQGMMKEKGMTKINIKDPNLDPKMRSLYNKIATTNSVENGYQGQRQNEAFTTGITSLGGGITTGDEASVLAKTTNLNTGKLEDQTVTGMAESSKVVNDNFREFASTLVPAAEAIAAFNEQLKQTIKTLGAMPADQRGAGFSNLVRDLYGTPATPQDQSHGGKPSK